MIKEQLKTDKFAMTLSLACVAHCFLVPSFLILTSGFLSFSIDNDFIHTMILCIAAPVSTYALVLGYKNHKKTSFFVIGVTGLLILIAVLLSETMLGESLVKGLTLFGSILIIFAHFKNHQLCKEIDCTSCHD
jgi:hypothetical protein